MESSRRDLLNDVAEHRSILENNQNAYYPRFSFTPKIGIAFFACFVFTVKRLVKFVFSLSALFFFRVG